jgi:hypothetical protein
MLGLKTDNEAITKLQEKNRIMKTLKIMACAFTVAAAFTLCASSAKAGTPGIGMTTNFTPLNVSITVITDGVEKVTSSADTYPVGQAKINNSYLLTLFGHWAGTNWPSGAKLVIGWDEPWTGDVLVVDKTGTNVLYNASTNEDNYFYVDYLDYEGAGTWKYSSTDTYTEYNLGYFELYDDDVYLPYTFFYGYGGTTFTFTQNTSSHPTWNVNATLNGVYTADDFYFLNRYDVTVTGNANTSGSGKGYVDYLEDF